METAKEDKWMDFFNSEHDPYEILGLPLKADWELVKATYKSLIKIYHPDVFKGDKTFASERLNSLNDAYNFLSDPAIKSKYDKQIAESPNTWDEYRPNDPEDEQEAAIKALKAEWEFACEYHPHLPEQFDKLKKLDKKTALVFMATLVEKKLYHEASELQSYLENSFLVSKFGDDEEVKAAASYAIYSGAKSYALELNKSLLRLGVGSKEAILTKLSITFPDIGYDVLVTIGRGDLISRQNPNLKSFETKGIKRQSANRVNENLNEKYDEDTTSSKPGGFLTLLSSTIVLITVVIVIAAISDAISN